LPCSFAQFFEHIVFIFSVLTNVQIADLAVAWLERNGLDPGAD